MACFRGLSLIGYPLPIIPADGWSKRPDRTEGILPSAERILYMAVQLQVVLGKQRGKNLSFATGEFVFGRGPECHVRPNSELVSRQHCMLAVAKDSVLIRDLGSINGTLVNGTRVREPQILQDGDRIQIGPLVLLVKIP